MRIYNVTDLPEYGPARKFLVNSIPVLPGKAFYFDVVRLPAGRRIHHLTPANSGMLVLGGKEPVPLFIRQAYADLQKVAVPEVVLPEPEGQAPDPEPDHRARGAWLKERSFSELKEGYAAVVGRRYLGPRSQQKVLEALFADADETKLTKWVEAQDG